MPPLENNCGNAFAVIRKSSGVMFARDIPPEMSATDALIFAAWIVRLADQRGGEDFAAIMRQVRGQSTAPTR